jgi:molybdopterin-containing oxidoreductase family membrane subunit
LGGALNVPLEDTYYQRLEGTVLTPLQQTSKRYRTFLLLILAALVWGLYAYMVQLRYGLLAIGTRDVTMYGFYIVNFIFFIGISYAGALVSAILRLTHAGWRAPITRISELIAVGGLTDGALQPLIDLGRPDRAWHLIIYGRFQSALLWDLIAITTYLIGSFIYLYLPLIPDFALLRDRIKPGVKNLRGRLYTLLAVGWQNTVEQRQRLEKAIGIMAVAMIPLAVSVHTVVAFIFSMTLRPGWNSTIYGIYFVVGAVFSGTGMLLIILAIVRKFCHFEEYITEKHFRNLGYLFLTMLLFYFYLAFTEYLTPAYKLAGEDKALLTLLMLGKNAPWFWLFVVGGLVVPAFLLIFSRRHTITKVVLAAVLVVIGMWLKRFIIIIPTLEVPLMPFDFSTYSPSWVEISIGIATLAGFSVMIVLAAKFMPLLSLWEMKEHGEVEKTSHLPARETRP